MKLKIADILTASRGFEVIKFGGEKDFIRVGNCKFTGNIIATHITFSPDIDPTVTLVGSFWVYSGGVLRLLTSDVLGCKDEHHGYLHYRDYADDDQGTPPCFALPIAGDGAFDIAVAA